MIAGVPAVSRSEARGARPKCACSRGLFVCGLVGVVLLVWLMPSALHAGSRPPGMAAPGVVRAQAGPPGWDYVVVATDKGVFYTADIMAADPTWQDLNAGFSSDEDRDVKQIWQEPEEWSGGEQTILWAVTTTGVWKNSNAFGGGQWTQVLDAATASAIAQAEGYDCWAGPHSYGIINISWVDIEGSIFDPGFVIVTFSGRMDDPYDKPWAAWTLHTHDGGATWHGITCNEAWFVGNYLGGAIDLALSKHDPYKVFITARTGCCGGSGLWVSTDQGHSFEKRKEFEGSDPALLTTGPAATGGDARLYLGFNDIVIAQLALRSDDEGYSWVNKTAEGMDRLSHTHALLGDAQDADVVIYGDKWWNYSEDRAETDIWLSQDGMDTWSTWGRAPWQVAGLVGSLGDGLLVGRYGGGEAGDEGLVAFSQDGQTWADKSGADSTALFTVSGGATAVRAIVGIAPSPTPEGLCVDVSVSPGTTLTLTAEGWPTPNPLAVTVTMGNNLTTTVEGLEVQFSLEGSAPPRLYVIPEDGHGEGEYSNGNYYEEWPIGNLAAGEVISTVWSVWVQPSTALTLNCWADLYVDAEWVDEGSEEVSIPQASIHPVIVIPGMLGSWKVNAAGEWAIEPLYGIYDPLLDELEAAGYEDGVTLFPFPYDWKRSNSSTAVLLMDEIAAILSSPAVPYVDYSQVDLVGHSQGTMVARFYVQRYWGEDTVSKFISLAGPFRGAPMAYVAWEGLDPSVMPPEIATPLGFLVRLWAVKAGYGHWIWIWVPLPPPFPPGILVPIPIVSDPELYNYAHNEIPSLGQVLPSDDYLPEYLQDSQGTPFPYGPEPGHEVNTFLNDLNGDVSTTLVDRLGPGNIIAFVGNITDTQEFYEVVPQPPDLAPLWEYGMSEDHNYSAHLGSGDGTVPLISADLSTLDSRVITVSAAGYDYVDHVGIAQYAQNKVIEYLTGIERAANWDDAGLTPDTQQGDLALIIYNLCPVDLVVTDPAGRRVGTDLSTAKSVNEVSGAFYSGHSPDDRDPELIVIHNPLQGPYTISVRGTDKGPYSVGVQLISGPQSINLGTFTGEAVPGEISTFTVEYPAQERPYTARYALRYRGVEYIADTLVVHDPLTVGGLHEDRVQARRESPATSDEKTPDILPMVVYYQVYTLDPLRLNVLAVRVESEKGTQMVEVAQSHQVDKDGTIRFRAKSADEKVPLEVMGEFIFGKERKP